jgi:rhodanese-related sulfurtransferase
VIRGHPAAGFPEARCKMAQFVEFVGNHPLLFMALGLILGLLTVNLLVGSKGTIDPHGAVALINQREALVVDVRPTADFAKGHIVNALNLPMNGFAKQIPTLEKHKTQPIVVNCRSGAQSSQACSQLRRQGFTEVYNLRGGILAWQGANLPVSRKHR